jgi:hypothetical protein
MIQDISERGASNAYWVCPNISAEQQAGLEAEVAALKREGSKKLFQERVSRVQLKTALDFDHRPARVA